MGRDCALESHITSGTQSRHERFLVIDCENTILDTSAHEAVSLPIPKVKTLVHIDEGNRRTRTLSLDVE